MINKYKNSNKELKQYKVSKVKSGTAKNGASFTVCTIADSKKVGDQWAKEYYGVFSWQPNIDLKDGDFIELTDITALEVKKEEYNGEELIKKTIFADIKVIPQAPQEQKPAELTPIDDDSLPF
jgi:hypothetical protein